MRWTAAARTGRWQQCGVGEVYGGGGPMVVTSKAVLNQAASLLRLDPRALQKTRTTRDMLAAQAVEADTTNLSILPDI